MPYRGKRLLSLVYMSINRWYLSGLTALRVTVNVTEITDR